MMGNPHEAGGAHDHRPQRAVLPGVTALTGVIVTIVQIVSVAVPNWGYYASSGRDISGHFGPFATCPDSIYFSYCKPPSHHLYRTTEWMTGAGICAGIAVLALCAFSTFSVLHVAMQVQRREIWVRFNTAVFLKVVTSSIAALAILLAVILASIHFSVGGWNNGLLLRMGIIYYIQIVLIVVMIILVILSYLSWRKAKKHPLPLMPKNHMPGVAYEVRNGHGVSMTAASGAPYLQHGQPRFPNQPQAQPPYMHTNYTPQQQPNAYTNNGFTTATLQVPATAANSSSATPVGQPQMMPQQAVPMQPIRAIQPVQGVPQNSVQVLPSATSVGGGGLGIHLPPINNAPLPPGGGGGVSFTPGGKTGTGYTQMAYGGSMESLNSTHSSTLSNLSYGSTISTGSGHGPLRSSLKKPKNKDKSSISSECSSKRVRLSLGAEQTSV